MKARESRFQEQSDSAQAMAPSQDSAYWDYYYSQPPYGSPYWSVNVMAPTDRSSWSQGPGDDNSSGLPHPGPGDLPESEPEVGSSLVLPNSGFVACSTANDKR